MEEKKRSYYNCSVEGCLNSTLNCDLSFFNLPLNSERRNEWLRVIHREDLIDSSCFRTRVCEAHFRPNCILIHANRKSLKKTSIPELLLPLPKNFANKGIQAIFETADANVQCDYDSQTNAQEETLLYLSKDIPQKRKPLSEAKVDNPSRTAESRRGQTMPVTEQGSNTSISNIILDLEEETPRDPNEDFQSIYNKQPDTPRTNITQDPLISTNTTSPQCSNNLETNKQTVTDHIPTSDLMKFLVEQKNKEKRDEDIERFFKSIAATVKKFSERHQAIIKNSVFECVSKIEMKEIDEKEQRHNEVADTRHEQPEQPEQFVRCGLCNIAITGFVYACVQCGERACGACDAQRRHTRHHVMRAPCGRFKLVCTHPC
ncbi:uncharacterized protein LOC135084073 [Ostrinia nubilalis]|uniref:uncharacterized protein LOC135084073 n=1 Tax=Ostrinia nubilalis TaxID=29057 RepID=UPI0030822658